MARCAASSAALASALYPSGCHACSASGALSLTLPSRPRLRITLAAVCLPNLTCNDDARGWAWRRTGRVADSFFPVGEPVEGWLAVPERGRGWALPGGVPRPPLAELPRRLRLTGAGSVESGRPAFHSWPAMAKEAPAPSASAFSAAATCCALSHLSTAPRLGCGSWRGSVSRGGLAVSALRGMTADSAVPPGLPPGANPTLLPAFAGLGLVEGSCAPS